MRTYGTGSSSSVYINKCNFNNTLLSQCNFRNNVTNSVITNPADDIEWDISETIKWDMNKPILIEIQTEDNGEWYTFGEWKLLSDYTPCILNNYTGLYTLSTVNRGPDFDIVVMNLKNQIIGTLPAKDFGLSSTISYKLVPSSESEYSSMIIYGTSSTLGGGRYTDFNKYTGDEVNPSESPFSLFLNYNISES